MSSYQRLDGNSAHSVFENPFENRELDDFNISGSNERGDSNPLLSSFGQHNDESDNDSFDDGEYLDTSQTFRNNADDTAAVDNRLANSNTHEVDENDRIDESLFAEGVQQQNLHDRTGSIEGASINPMSNGGNVQPATISSRITGTIDRVTSNSPGRKLLHRFFPKYVSLASTSSSNYYGQVIGNGLQNDGVFSNMMAKPTARQEASDDVPPTYEEAAADATPPYWESTVFSPYGNGVFVDGLPVGNIINFVWNLMVSAAFQFVGFLLTYLLHTSHAAKEGSRAGLGITFMSYGYYMIPDDHFFNSFKPFGSDDASGSKFEPIDPNDFDVDSNHPLKGSVDEYHSSLSGVDTTNVDSTANDNSGQYFDENSAPIFAYGLVALGVFIFIKSLLDYHRAKQMEKVILQSPSFETEAEASPATEEV